MPAGETDNKQINTYPILSGSSRNTKKNKAKTRGVLCKTCQGGLPEEVVVLENKTMWGTKPCHQLKAGRSGRGNSTRCEQVDILKKEQESQCGCYRVSTEESGEMGPETRLGDRSHRLCKTWGKVGFYSNVVGS